MNSPPSCLNQRTTRASFVNVNGDHHHEEPPKRTLIVDNRQPGRARRFNAHVRRRRQRRQVSPIRKVAVGETVRNCIGAIRLDAALGGKSLLMEEIAGDLSVQADPQRLAQIINSLIANSYKYGDNHSPIRVRASRLGDGFGRIEILNAGPGIPLRERDALFQPFGHENRGRQVPGAGLGLSIAKMLAEKQGGRIDFESIPGRQTRFWIDLPLAA